MQGWAVFQYYRYFEILGCVQYQYCRHFLISCVQYITEYCHISHSTTIGITGLSVHTKLTLTTITEIHRYLLIDKFLHQLLLDYLWHTCWMMLCSIYYSKIFQCNIGNNHNAFVVAIIAVYHFQCHLTLLWWVFTVVAIVTCSLCLQHYGHSQVDITDPDYTKFPLYRKWVDNVSQKFPLGRRAIPYLALLPLCLCMDTVGVDVMVDVV